MPVNEHCPRCKSEKHTSLPFGNIVRANGAARTYRCLMCGFFFVRGVSDEVHEVLLRAAGDTRPGLPAR